MLTQTQLPPLTACVCIPSRALAPACQIACRWWGGPRSFGWQAWMYCVPEHGAGSRSCCYECSKHDYGRLRRKLKISPSNAELGVVFANEADMNSDSLRCRQPRGISVLALAMKHRIIAALWVENRQQIVPRQVRPRITPLT
jgi:hypothetical protein